MEMITSTLLWISFLYFHSTHTSANACSPVGCENPREKFPNIRFPFYLQPSQTPSCGYPGFGLFCNRTGPIINLPKTGDHIVNHINYLTQEIFIDPGFCIPGRLLSFSLRNTPFRGDYTMQFTILNCSLDLREVMFPMIRLGCLSGSGFTVVALADAIQLPFNCRNVSTVGIPVQKAVRLSGYSNELLEDLQLTWDIPDCKICESKGQMCQLNSQTHSGSTACFEPPGKGIPRPVKYGIIIGAGIPGLILIIGLASFILNVIRTSPETQNRDEVDLLTFPPRQDSNRKGLDGLTIESYPKFLLGEIQGLPNPNDGICSICLTDYLPKDVLRTIPKCDHYFHVACIDEWLKKNATCPVCRKSPESSSPVIISSSAS